MKYLKYILGVLAILVVIFLALGIIKPTITYDCEVMVEKPKAESWSVSQDQEKMAEWLMGFQKIEHVSGTPGTVGAVSNVHFVTNDQPMTIQETITDISPDESMSMTYETDFMDMDYKIAMHSSGGNTKISSSTTAKGNGMISKSIMVLIGGSLKTQEVTNLNNLKKVIEKNEKNYAASNVINTNKKDGYKTN